MRRFQKQQILEIISGLHTIHCEIKSKLEQKDFEFVQKNLVDCQEIVIQIGDAIEQIEGNETEAVRRLEQYCECVYQVSIQLQKLIAPTIYIGLEEYLNKAENAVKRIPETIETVFLPYKVSMWDSLESVWQAADKDDRCDAYVIPIPYYDKNPDKSLGTEYYEGDRYPDYVPITYYGDYDFEQRHPDVIFIHNPYDQFNNMTSVHPFFYSNNLKNFTDLLVYIPYYSTAGGMNGGQSHCLSYYIVDYIVIQAEKYRSFFDPNLPVEKLLPLGSPKFDRVANVCKNPPEPPVEWRDKMAGKKVYFYNTSISGLIQNTPVFLKKMEYVFRCFAEKQDVCLLWRPHPLMETAFDSMRPDYKPVYDALKRYFMTSGIGIYDDTPDIAETIALCDAYIGDGGTSVTSLFGIVGKPLFILNNYLDNAPGEEDWRGEIIKADFVTGNNQWKITQGNKLYYSPQNDHRYKYCCDLSDYAYGSYYVNVIRIHGKDYVCPLNAQDILIVSENGINRKITLKRCVEQQGAFWAAIACGNYLFLIPNHYPAIVRYDTVNDRVDYLEDHLDIFIATVKGERRVGGYCVQNGYLFLASPKDNYLLAIHAETGKEQVLTTKADNQYGCLVLCSDGRDLWFLPYEGAVITRWNPETREVHEYMNQPEGLKGKEPIYGYECMDKLFSNIAFCGNYVYFSPLYANMYIKLDKRNGVMTEWKPPFEQPDTYANGHYLSSGRASFIRAIEDTENKVYSLFSLYDRKTYHINLETNEYKEIKVEFDLEELRQNEPGFMECSEWMQYACQENAFNSLPDFLDGNITGNTFHKDRALQSFEKIAVNSDGTSGAKIYDYIYEKLHA